MKTKLKNLKLITAFAGFLVLVGIFFITKGAEASGGTTSGAVSLPEYIRNLYIAGLIIGPICALGVLIYAGYLYMFGHKVAEAKTMATNGVLGVIIFMCISAILAFIDPELLKFKWDGFDLSGLEYVNNSKNEEEDYLMNVKNQFYAGDINNCKPEDQQKCIDNCVKLFKGQCEWDPTNCKGHCRSCVQNTPCGSDNNCGCGLVCKPGWWGGHGNECRY